jgi:1,2-diacylglycerol 3-alpha-glucosyltransferase
MLKDGMKRRLAIVWTNFGPYHNARIQVLRRHFDVHAIELASNQRLYHFWRDKPQEQMHTLTNGDWEDQNRFAVALKLWRRLSLIQPDIVMVPGYASLAALSTATWGNTHSAITILMSESNYDDHQRDRFSEHIKGVMVRSLYDAGIVGGKRAASYLMRLGIPSEKIAYRYDVIDNEYFEARSTQGASAANIPSSLPYFLFVGRLAPEKNLLTLMEAHERYLSAGNTWALVIVGSGPMEEQLREEGRKRIGGGTLIFTGHKSVHEIADLYASAKCLVLPSTSEPWGLVVNEAMASGLPIIVSSKCGCADDLVADGSNGFQFDPCDVADLCSKMERISLLSEQDRLVMGDHSRKIIADYSPERWADEVARIVEVVAASSEVNRR